MFSVNLVSPYSVMPEMEGTYFHKIEYQLKVNDVQFEDLLLKHDKVSDDLGAMNGQVSELQQQMLFVNQNLQNLLAGQEKM